MRVPKVWRRSWKRTRRTPAPRSAALKRLRQLRGVERRAGVRVAEDEVVVGLEGAARVVALELGGDAVGQRHGAARAAATSACRTRRARSCAPHAHPAGAPVDVAPAQREQLALAQPGHRGGQVQRALDRAEVVVGDGARAAPRAPRLRKRMSGSLGVLGFAARLTGFSDPIPAPRSSKIECRVPR